MCVRAVVEVVRGLDQCSDRAGSHTKVQDVVDVHVVYVRVYLHAGYAGNSYTP